MDGLLEKTAVKRLGTIEGGVQKIRDHAWFKGKIDFDKVLSGDQDLNFGKLTERNLEPCHGSEFKNGEEDRMGSMIFQFF